MYGDHTQTSVSVHNYYVSFIDAYSRFTWLYLIKRKYDVFDIFLQFQAHVEHLIKTKIISVQSDLGAEYHNLNVFFSRNLGFRTMYLVLRHISKTVSPNISIAILLKLVYFTSSCLCSFMILE
jgi:hypothetical protein